MRKYLELDFVPSVTTLGTIFSFCDQSINLNFWAAFMNRSLVRVKKNIKVIYYEDNISVIKSTIEKESSAG